MYPQKDQFLNPDSRLRFRGWCAPRLKRQSVRYDRCVSGPRQQAVSAAVDWRIDFRGLLVPLADTPDACCGWLTPFCSTRRANRNVQIRVQHSTTLGGKRSRSAGPLHTACVDLCDHSEAAEDGGLDKRIVWRQ